ncbi:MAG: ATP-dependent helicase, partial [Acidimicrobiales bacterium]
ATHLAADLARVTSPAVDQVAWVTEQPPVVLKLALVDVGPLLGSCLWDEVTAVLTSATVPPALPVRLGLTKFDHLDVGSPFPYPDHGLLYCATHLPDRRRPDADAAVQQELAHLIQAAGGRTLALFTSLRTLKEAVEVLRERVPFRILAQSDMPKPALLEAFAADESTCLFATLSFWQGVDVPGATLSLVVIDRIPFPRPDDPLMQARRERAGPGAFRLVDLSRATTLLAQGAGRLIRSRDDRGVVAVLDRRLATASYRWDLVRALPPMARTRHRSEVEAFLAHARQIATSDSTLGRPV